jgi:tetratricopeptide (TPR) repeat protein
MSTAASVLFGVIAFIALAPRQEVPAKQDSPRLKEIDRLVEKLSDTDVAERDKAEKAIVDLAKELAHAFAALEKAKKSSDAETASRADRASKSLREAVAALATASKDADVTGRMAALDKRVVDAPGDPTSWLERGRLRLELKKYKEAIEDFERALALDPMSAEAFLGRATAKEGLEDFAGAIEDKNRVRMIEEMRARMKEKNPK